MFTTTSFESFAHARRRAAPYAKGMTRAVTLIAVASILQGCSSGSRRLQGPSFSALSMPSSSRPGPRPSPYANPSAPRGGYYKVGKPYTINGIRYTPRHQPSYDRVGVASWYGDKFHGRLTANGETYDMNAITAAHPTLPLPSLVRVTNMRTGRRLVVRVNDRGPYARNRIIDLSRRSAEILGLKRQGTGAVRVQYLGPARIGISASASSGRWSNLWRASLGRLSANRPRRRSVTGGASRNIHWVASPDCLAPRLRRVIANVAARYGRVRVNSTCRSPRHNRRVGGARHSHHLTGNAADIRVRGNWREASYYLRNAVGGYKHYGGGLFHIDLGRRRRF
ncbi:MAG: septal ring lytic transglycosylase RlpA family protein [Hyphomicrobiaceae bacterium]